MLAEESSLPDVEPRAQSTTTFLRRQMLESSDNVFEEAAAYSGFGPQPPLSPRSGQMPGIILTVEGDGEEDEVVEVREVGPVVVEAGVEEEEEALVKEVISPEVVVICDQRSTSARSSRRSRHQQHSHHHPQYQHHHSQQQHHHQPSVTPSSPAARSPSVTRMRRNGSNQKLREPGSILNGGVVGPPSSCVSRSQSMRTARRPHSVDPNQRFRHRISSIPNDLTLPSDLDPHRLASNQSLPLPGDEADILRLRNFSVTHKGVINRGDSFRSKSRSAHSVASLSSGHSPVQRLASDDSCRSAAVSAVVATVSNAVENGTVFQEQKQQTLEVKQAVKGASANEIPGPKPVRYRVLVLGAPDVGKSSLTRQFMTSEYICAYDSSIDEDNEKTVTVVLNGEESELTFMEHTYLDDVNCNFTSTYEPDAYLVVYSVTHKRSLQMAKEIIRFIRKFDSHIDRKALILVGNKMDLARLRMLTPDDGRSLAIEEGCKFIETSAGINHHVDELLVGSLTQIRLKLSSAEKMLRKRESVSLSGSAKGRLSSTSSAKCSGCAGCKAKGIFKKILKKACNRSKSCDNLHVL